MASQSLSHSIMQLAVVLVAGGGMTKIQEIDCCAAIVTRRPIKNEILNMETEETMISQEQLDNWFVYHSPSADQLPKYQAIREAAKVFAATIVANAPDCADTTAAVRKVREATMTANQAIACGGK